jgi:GAF domain-containing protein
MRPRSSSRPPPVDGRPRVRGDEIIAVLFEEMHDLHFARDSIEGGDFCLGLLLDKLPSRGGLIHFYDLTAREYVVVCSNGNGAEKLLLRRHPPTDPLLSAAMRKRGAVVINDAATNDAAFVERFEALGGARSVMIAPIMLGGRALGAIEIINPLDGGPYSDDEGHALQYMAEQLAEFVSSHGLVLDPARIQKQRQPSAPAHN